MTKVDKLQLLHHYISTMMVEIADCFKEPVKVTVMVRNPADNKKNVILSDEIDMDVATAEMKKLWENYAHVTTATGTKPRGT